MAQESRQNTSSPQNEQSIWMSFIQFIKKILAFFTKSLEDFNSKFPNLSRLISLTVLYFFAFIDLSYTMLKYLSSENAIVVILEPFAPFIKTMLDSTFLKIWMSPERSFLLSYLVIQFTLDTPIAFKFSKLIKYNIVLVFTLLVLQGLIISYFDLIFTKEIIAIPSRWAAIEPPVLFSPDLLASNFFLVTFVVFLLLYFYFYLCAIRGKFGTLPFKNLCWITDSVAFILRIKTPTMRVGKRKKDKEKDEEK